MGLMTLQDFRDDLSPASGTGSLQRSGVSTTYLDRWINQALREFGYALKFHELEGSTTFPTVMGQNAYAILGTLPGFRYVEELRKIAPGALSATPRLGLIIPETRSHYFDLIGDTTDPTTWGDPDHYHRYGLSIFLRPVPDSTTATLSMDYYKTIPPLVNPADTTPFSDDWDEAVSLGALARGFRHFGEYDRYLNVRNDFLAMVRSRQTEYELEEFPDGGISPLGPNDTATSREQQ